MVYYVTVLDKDLITVIRVKKDRTALSFEGVVNTHSHTHTHTNTYTYTHAHDIQASGF